MKSKGQQYYFVIEVNKDFEIAYLDESEKIVLETDHFDQDEQFENSINSDKKRMGTNLKRASFIRKDTDALR